MLSTKFLLTSFVVVIVPGTGVIYTVSTGLVLRQRASIAAAFGCTLGILPHLTASILGLSAILHMSARAFQALKIVGARFWHGLVLGSAAEQGESDAERRNGRSPSRADRSPAPPTIYRDLQLTRDHLAPCRPPYVGETIPAGKTICSRSHRSLDGFAPLRRASTPDQRAPEATAAIDSGSSSRKCWTSSAVL